MGLVKTSGQRKIEEGQRKEVISGFEQAVEQAEENLTASIVSHKQAGKDNKEAAAVIIEQNEALLVEAQRELEEALED